MNGNRQNEFVRDILRHLTMAQWGIFVSFILFAYAAGQLPGARWVATISPLPALFVWSFQYIRFVRGRLRDEYRRKTQEMQQDILQLRKMLQDERRERLRSDQAERSERILSFAQRDSNQRTPRRCILIICVHRSGSTWMLDALRCHPDVYMEPTAMMFNKLGAAGGRYPRGFSDTADCRVDFEIAPGKGAKIPAFPPDSDPGNQTGSFESPSIAIEKLHPEFFDNDADGFLERLEQVEKRDGITFQMIYQIREPESAITSFAKYKQRDPQWYSHVSENGIPCLLAGAYHCILSIASRRKGLLLDYRDLQKDPEIELRRVYQYIWPDITAADALALAERASAWTRRESRQLNTHDTFLGPQPGKPIGGDPTMKPFFRRARTELQLCNDAYQSLRKFMKIRKNSESDREPGKK